MFDITTIFNALLGNPYFQVITAFIALCSAIAAVTPTPAEGTWLAKVYKIIDYVALNIGKAKDKGELLSDENKGK